MRVRAERHGRIDASAIVAALHEPASWPSWLHGATTDLAGDEVTVTFTAFRPIRVRLALDRRQDGLAWRLIEGDVTALEGSIVVSGTGITWEHDLVLPVTLPGALVADLEALPRRWLEALVAVRGS
jgi:hypothetical protein